MTPKNRLNNPYYFVKQGVIFSINVTNDEKDPCGKHYVTYILDEEKGVKKGEAYLDVHGDYQVATADTPAPIVSTGKVDEAASAAVFPYFKITDTDNNDYYFWLDNFIEKGDVIETNKFKKTVHGGESTIDFAEDYVKTVTNAIATAVAGGTSFDSAKKAYPSYLFANAGDNITVNGKEITIKASGINASYTVSNRPLITEASVVTAAIDIINEKTIEYANGMLYNIGKRVTPGTAANPTKIIKSGVIEDLA